MWAFLPALSALSSGGVATASPDELLNNCFFVCYEAFGSPGHKPCWLSKLGVLGPAPPVGVLKDGELDVGCEPFASAGNPAHRESRRWEFPPNCVVQCWGWIYGEGLSLSLPF